jgi:hypothetical protein
MKISIIKGYSKKVPFHKMTKSVVCLMPSTKFSFILIYVGLALSLTGCKKFVEIPPPTNSITDNSVYTNDATAIAVLTGMYVDMGNSGTGNLFTGNNGISLLAGLSADEFTLYSGVISTIHPRYYRNSLVVNVSPGAGFENWKPLYNYVYRCNAAIEGLKGSTSLTPSIKQQLLGEAKFLRAFYFFYLVNFFGEVPLTLTTDYEANARIARNSKTNVYHQIINDLKEAQQLLTTSYLNATLLTTTTERVRPNKWAATALLARAYLYNGNYADAEAEANALIANNSMYSLLSLNNVFLKNSSEAIWQLQPITTGRNTEDGWTFIIPSTGLTSPSGNQGNPAYLSNSLLSSFEPGDQRRTNLNWVDTVMVGTTKYYFPYKYKSAILNAPVTEYLMVLRLGEQFLIRAEARAQQNNIAGAQSDLNSIRSRAGLPNTLATDKATLLTAILNERQVELFTEWGHRWFDLKRTANIDQVMSVETPKKANGAAWQSYQQLYPLPLGDIKGNLNLQQNDGY